MEPLSGGLEGNVLKKKIREEKVPVHTEKKKGLEMNILPKKKSTILGIVKKQKAVGKGGSKKGGDFCLAEERGAKGERKGKWCIKRGFGARGKKKGVN